MDTQVAVPVSRTRPRGYYFFGIGALVALSASLVVWCADRAFYAPFGPLASELSSWSPWSMLDLLVQLLGWGVAGVLWLWWPQRRVVAVVAAVVIGAGAVATLAWADHEADRALAGTPVWPASVLPFSFSARAVEMIPVATARATGVPSQALLLGFGEGLDSALIYDPATGETRWVGSDEAGVSLLPVGE